MYSLLLGKTWLHSVGHRDLADKQIVNIWNDDGHRAALNRYILRSDSKWSDWITLIPESANYIPAKEQVDCSSASEDERNIKLAEIYLDEVAGTEMDTD